MTTPLLYSVVDAAAELGIGRTKLLQLVNAGDLELVRIGRAVRITRVSLERYVEKLQKRELEGAVP